MPFLLRFTDAALAAHPDWEKVRDRGVRYVGKKRPPNMGQPRLLSGIIKIARARSDKSKKNFSRRSTRWGHSQNKNPQLLPAASSDGSDGLEFRALAR